MKNKKIKLSLIIAVIALVIFSVSYIITYANNTKTIYVNLTKLDSNNEGYAINNPNNAGTGNYIWNIKTYSNKEGSESAKQRNLYCVRANYGDSWNNGKDKEKTIIEYNLSYDIQTERESLLNKIGSSDKEGNKIVEKLLDPSKNYRELLWIFDNLYIENETDKDEFLSRIGILKDDEYNEYYNKETLDTYEYVLTDADIKAVQRAAIWYFTNFKLYNEEKFNLEDKTNWLYYTTDGESYTELSLLGRGSSTSGEDRSKQAVMLYKYLITQATDHASEYTPENNYKLSSPASVKTDGLIQQTEGKYKLQTNRVGSNYIIGPITISKNNDSLYSIELKVTNQKGENVNYQFTNASGETLGNVQIKDLVGKEEGFYLSIPRNILEQLNIEISITSDERVKTLWEQGTETGDKIEINSEQPIIEVESKPVTVTTTFTSKPEEFDLALRKYITHVNNVEVPNSRVPDILTDSLQTGTTATYRHRKDPVLVQENDIVTYTIAIYNEGNKAGYASEIVDQLPTGLISSTDNPGEVVSKDKNGTDKNTYKLEYNTTANTITFKITNTPKDLEAYEKEKGLDYETITIKCKVVQEPDAKQQKILTNVAWISKAHDSVTERDILNKGEDRDSEPQTSPSVNRNNMETYKGKETNQNELGDSNYFYEGEQDDDDFEKLVLMPEEKIFDLALFKHIAAISKDQKIEPGEYVTDNKNIDGTYLRAPVVEKIENGKVIYKEDSKEALIVEPGDYVLYTIRVYNEGEINGYASKIKDTLPIGLEFVVENEEYNGIWNLEGLDEDGRQVVSTTWFAKGQGAELNSVQGEPNYTANLLKALNPDGEISDENPDYLDAQVLCRVVEKATSDRVLVNYAQISDDSDENGEPVDDVDSTPDEWIDGDDDQDIERVVLQYFDLSLRKFITSVNGEELKNEDGTYMREPVVDVSPLVNGTDTTATYTHPKTPVSLRIGDKVVYTIRVYNEGTLNGYASEVKDYLPPYLTFATDSQINEEYGWEVSEDGRVVTTDYLSTKELTAFNGVELDYEDLKIECIISDKAIAKENITNIAEISEYTYNDHVVENDIDSESDNMKEDNYLPEDEDLPDYKDDEMDKPYIPGNEDDDDFEKVYVQEFDLSLRKFITEVQENEVTTRVPQVDTDPLQEGTTAKYEHPKDPLLVHVGDTVIYTIRIYNEGEIDGYAKEITDDIPEYLEYLPEHDTNVEYMWKMYDENDEETDEVEKAVKVKTEYLSKENGEENLIKAYDGETLDYKDIKIAFKVKDPNSNEIIITNQAQISEDTDEEGKDVEDRDSTPNEWNEGEDDQDVEHVKVEYFDLALLKYVTKVILIENGKQTVTETGYNGLEDPEPEVKVELHRKKLNEVVVKFGFGIKITNEGDIPGYATEIKDHVPEGLRFVAEDNPDWTDEGNNIITTRKLEGTLLQPGESAVVEVILTWINGNNNLGLKTNIAEISEDKNEYGIPDRDSTPDNFVDEEDDQDHAKVLLAVETGRPQTYFTLTLGLLTIVLVGVVLIKKFVI